MKERLKTIVIELFGISEHVEWNKHPEGIIEAADRLKDAEIENVAAIELIEKYNRPDCRIYADPPYLLSSRTGRNYNGRAV